MSNTFSVLKAFDVSATVQSEKHKSIVSQTSQAADQCWFCSEIDLGLWKMDSVPWWMRDTQPVITPVELAVAEIVFNYW